MKRRIAMAAVLAAVVIAIAASLGYAVHLSLNYARIQNDLKARGNVEVRPVGDNRSLAEGGVVAGVRREMHIRDRRFALVWLIVIPSTGRAYSCDYEEGFQNFEKGDSVTLIHKPAELDEPDAPSYLVGENHGKEEKTARVRPMELDIADSQDADP